MPAHAARRSVRAVSLIALAYVGAILLVPLLGAGANLASKLNNGHAPDAPPHGEVLPPPPTHDPLRKTAVVLSSAYGAEITDFLPHVELLGRSRAFNVYAVAPERKVLPFVNANMAPTSLDFVPHFSFSEYQAAIGTAPDLILLPWFPGYTPERDAPVADWVRANAGPRTTIVTICAGTQILADTGLLDGRTATTNVAWFGKLEAQVPSATWIRNVRYADDGTIITSTNVASGIDAVLHAIDRFAGRATAERVARDVGYTHTRYLDDPRFTPPSLPAFAQTAIGTAIQPGRQEMGVLLYDGVSEFALAGLLDLYTAPHAARTHLLAPQRSVVHSRHGLVLLPRFDFHTVAPLSRVVVPGGDATDARRQTVAAWSRAWPDLPVDEIDKSVGNGESAYDATLKDLARSQNGMLASGIGQALFYPAERIALTSSPTSAVAGPVALAALGAALVFTATSLLKPRRRLAPTA